MVLPREGLIGSITILDKDGYGSVTASGARIINLANPVGLQDAATKDYVDSLSIGNHAGSHQSGGSDQIDGYQLAIAYTPINYTAPSSNILGQHLRRIDNKLGTLGVGTGDFKSDGTVSMTGNINVGNNNIINVNLVDGYSIPDLAIAITSISNSLNNHSSRHENGGADEIDVTGLSGLLADPQVGIAHASSHQSGGVDQIDGYQIEVSYTPVNYEVPPSNVLGQHLKRIDDAIGALSGSGEPVQVSIEVTSDGQTTFTLPQTPHADGYVQMFVNGLKQQYGVDYYGNGTAIIYTGTLPLKDTDAVEFWYLTATSSINNRTSQTIIATFGAGDSTVISGQYITWSRYTDSFPSNDDWEIISDGAYTGSDSALLMPEIALGHLVKVSGFINTLNSAITEEPHEVTLHITTYNQETDTTTQVASTTNYKYSGLTSPVIPLSFNFIIDLRNVTDRRNMQVLFQCLTDNTELITMGSYGGYFTFEVKFI